MIAIDLNKSNPLFVIENDGWLFAIDYSEDLQWHGWLISPNCQKINTEVSEDSFEACLCGLRQELDLVKYPELIEAFQLSCDRLKST